MDIILNPHYTMLLLAALTFVCGWLVIPYRMNLYNTEWLPRWILYMQEHPRNGCKS